jgi:hypothetical protein
VQPTDLALGPDGRSLYVRAAYQINIYEPADSGGLPLSFRDFWLHESLSPYDQRRGRVDGAGRYYDPNYRYPSHGDAQYFYGIYPTRVPGSERLEVPAFGRMNATRRARYMITATSGRLVRGLSHAPFEPVPAWDVTPNGTILGGGGGAYVLYEIDARGDTIATLDGTRARRAVPSDVARDSARTLQARIDSLPVPLSRVLGTSDRVLAGELPDSFPSFKGVHVTEAGDVWIEVWPERSGTRLFDVFTADGRYTESVEFSVPLVDDPPPFFTSDAIYGVTREPETGIERVVKLSIRRGQTD